MAKNLIPRNTDALTSAQPGTKLPARILNSILTDLIAFAHEPKFRVILLFFLLCMSIFTFERLAILLCMPSYFFETHAGEIIRAFLIGIRFDLVIAATLVIPLMLLFPLAPGWMHKKPVQAAISWLCGIILAVVVFGCIADFFFFRQFSERLNNKALDYLEFGVTYKLIWNEYPILSAFFGVAVIAAIAKWAFRRLCFTARFASLGGPSLPAMIIWVLVLFVAIACSIRGNFQSKPINTGLAYFTNSSSVVQLTLNGLFTFREAIVSECLRNDELKFYYKLIPPPNAINIVRAHVAAPGTTFIEDSKNPLRRITDTGKPQQNYNVVLVILESLSWHYIESLGGLKGLTPNLDALVQQGISMDRCFACANRTVRSLAAVVCSFPDLPGKGVLTRSQAEGTFITLGSVLKDRGYDTMFLYSGQGLYDHMQSFFASNGFSEFVFEEQLTHRTVRTDLGYCDEDLFNQALDEFAKKKGDTPFFATIMTLSFHYPFLFPQGRTVPLATDNPNKLQMECVRYVDWTIGQFLAKARTQKYFDNTIFVFTADHQGGFLEHPHTPESYRVPFVMYAPGIIKPQRINTVCSHLDIAPTIMQVLGGTYEHCFFGSDVISRPAEKGMAFEQNGSELTLINADGDIVRAARNAEPVMLRLTDKNRVEDLKTHDFAHTQELSDRAIAIVQTAGELFNNESYNVARNPSENAAIASKNVK